MTLEVGEGGCNFVSARSPAARRKPRASPGMRTGQPRDLLSERDLGTAGGPAEEPADGQADHYLPAARRGIEQPSLVAAVHPMRHRAAPWAGR